MDPKCTSKWYKFSGCRFDLQFYLFQFYKTICMSLVKRAKMELTLRGKVKLKNYTRSKNFIYYSQSTSIINKFIYCQQYHAHEFFSYLHYIEKCEKSA